MIFEPLHKNVQNSINIMSVCDNFTRFFGQKTAETAG